MTIMQHLPLKQLEQSNFMHLKTEYSRWKGASVLLLMPFNHRADIKCFFFFSKDPDTSEAKAVIFPALRVACQTL